jgi:dihydropteroate synthase
MSKLPINAATLTCGRFVLPLSRPLVMGIVNVTPDSFQQEGRHRDSISAVLHARRLIDEGADILDIGAESTRPGAVPIGIEEELARLIPVLKEVLALNIPVSVDTRHPEVMRRVALCAMHMQGEPLTMQDAPAYRSVVAEVQEFFYLTYKGLVDEGIAPGRIVFDPGIGFGKTTEHNVQLIQQLKDLVSGLPYPVAIVVGVSRKSLIGALTGRVASERLVGSVMAAVAAVQQGANIVRVHDVAATVDAIKVWQALAR